MHRMLCVFQELGWFLFCDASPYLICYEGKRKIRIRFFLLVDQVVTTILLHNYMSFECDNVLVRVSLYLYLSHMFSSMAISQTASNTVTATAAPIPIRRAFG
jgi:hypothetical protein